MLVEYADTEFDIGRDKKSGRSIEAYEF